MVLEHIRGFLRKPPKIETLSFPERVAKECEMRGMATFLYGKYEQLGIIEDFDAPPGVTYQPFVMIMAPEKARKISEELPNGGEAEFEALVHEMSIRGYMTGAARGRISNSVVQFQKKYDDGWREPIEYNGKAVGKVYRGEWKFGEVNHGTFVLSFQEDALRFF